MYLAGVEEPHELPDVPQNAALLEYLRARASPLSGPDDYALGTDWPAVRTGQPPPGIETEDRHRQTELSSRAVLTVAAPR